MIGRHIFHEHCKAGLSPICKKPRETEVCLLRKREVNDAEELVVQSTCCFPSVAFYLFACTSRAVSNRSDRNRSSKRYCQRRVRKSCCECCCNGDEHRYRAETNGEHRA